MSRSSIVLVVLLALIAMAVGPPRSAVADDDAAALKRLLDAYDARGGGNTIPIEKEILRLRDENKPEALAQHLSHRRFGGTVLWALAEIGSEGVLEKAIAALESAPLAQRAGSALHLARLGGEAVCGWLHALAAEEDLDVRDCALVRIALLRAGDNAALVAAKAALGSDDAATVARALLELADARRIDFLHRFAELLPDERALADPIRSRYGVTKTEQLENGGFRSSTTHPDWKTVGAVALEAANRVVAPTTPEYIAWWYEAEKKPRFGFGDGAAERVASYVAADAAAAKAGAPSAQEAIGALVGFLRGSAIGRMRLELAVGKVAFDGAWRIEYTADGERARASVGKDLEVTPLE